MRYLKIQTLNRRMLYDNRVALDAANNFTVAASTVMTLPKSNSAISSPVTGMMRYNTTSNDVEVYQGSSGTWRAIRYKESTQITQQNLGAGDGATVYFGPLNPAPPSVVQTGSTWGGQNLLVIVENVLQLFNTNYTVVNNPTIAARIYTPTTATATSLSSSTIYFNTALTQNALSITGATASGTTVTVTFTAQTAAPFAAGSSIVVTGFTPSGFNGTYTVTSCNTTTLVYTAGSSPASPATVIGTVTSSNAVYPASLPPYGDIVGATVTGSSFIQASTLVSSYTVDPYTDALTSITLSKPTITGTINANVSLTITETSATGTGYYLFFSSPVPYGKQVNVLIGFDQ